MILREINKPGLDSWHSERFPTPKSLTLSWALLFKGYRGSFLDCHVAWALGCRHKFRLLPRLRVSGTMPPFRQHFLMAWIEQVCNVLYYGRYTAHSGSSMGVGSEGNRMCLSFTCIASQLDIMQMAVRQLQLWRTAAVHSVVILSNKCIRPVTPQLHGNYKQFCS